MRTLLVQPKDSRDLRPQDLESLVTELRTELASVAPDLVVQLGSGDDDHRAGVTWVEVIHVTLDALSLLSGGLAVREVVERVSSRWAKRRSKEKGDGRPRTVAIYGPDGQPVSKVVLDEDASEPRVIVFDDRKRK